MTGTSQARHHQTQIVSDADIPLVRMVREFDAPPAQVFRAHAEADLVVQWLGPRNAEMRVERFDFRTGGSYRYVHAENGTEFGFFGSFHEVRPSELIVQTFTFDGVPDGVALERIALEAIGDRRTRLTSTSLTESFASRDAFVASGIEDGVVEAYERLDELLAAQG